MKQLYFIGFFLVLTACGGTGKTYHTINVIKPIYHHGYYKKSVWHKKLQLGKLRIRWFEKQGVKTVKMKG